MSDLEIICHALREAGFPALANRILFMKKQETLRQERISLEALNEVMREQKDIVT